MKSIEKVLPAPVEIAKQPRINNLTPFSAQYIQMMDVADQGFHVIVARQTFDMNILTAEKTPALAEIQEPLCTEDQYYGEPETSSLIQESDFAPFKPRCDLIFNHVKAYAPDGKPNKRWPIAVQFGDWRKELSVVGPRFLEPSVVTGWVLSEPEPCLEVPVRYENAWGGTCRLPLTAKNNKAAEQHWSFAENTVGCGFADSEWLKKSKVADLDAPQIEELKQPFRVKNAFQQQYPVVGLGAVSRWWQPRLQFAGTYDEHWKRTRWPRLPEDFEFDYWNCAPSDQQIPYPEGGEQVVLSGITPHGRLVFNLPDEPLMLLLHLNAGFPLLKPMNRDTVIFNFATMQLSIVQRAVVAVDADVAAIDIGQWDVAQARAHNEALYTQDWTS